MASCRCILKKLYRDKRITKEEYDKLLRNLKTRPLEKTCIFASFDADGCYCDRFHCLANCVGDKNKCMIDYIN